MFEEWKNGKWQSITVTALRWRTEGDFDGDAANAVSAADANAAIAAVGSDAAAARRTSTLLPGSADTPVISATAAAGGDAMPEFNFSAESDSGSSALARLETAVPAAAGTESQAAISEIRSSRNADGPSYSVDALADAVFAAISTAADSTIIQSVGAAFASSAFTITGAATAAFGTGAYLISQSGLTWSSFQYSSSYQGYYFSSSSVIDAEKSSLYSNDANMCWAGTSANMLYWAGWNNFDSSLTSEDGVFQIFREGFYLGASYGGGTQYGNEWYLTGNYQCTGWGGWDQCYPYSGGYYADEVDNASTYISYIGVGDANFVMTVISELSGGKVGGLSIGWYYDGERYGGHAITLWGYTYDDSYSVTDPRYITGLIVTDSDDNYSSTASTDAPNVMKVLDVEWNESYGTYFFTEYNGGHGLLEGVTFLEDNPFTAVQNPMIVGRGGEVSSKTVLAGEVSSGWTVAANGTMYVSGTVEDTVISGANALMNVYGGGLAQNIQIQISGGQVLSGGTASSTSIMGGYQYISQGGVASVTTLLAAWQNVYSGGLADSTTVNSSGTQTILNGGLAQNTEIRGGEQVISAGGEASNTVIVSGRQDVYSQGKAVDTTVSSGWQYVQVGASVSGTQLHESGGQNIFSGAVATDTEIHSGGGQVVYSAGTAQGTTVYSGGRQNISSGGIASATQVMGGMQNVYSGGIAYGTVVESDGTQYVSGGTVSNTLISGGAQYVSSGAVVKTVQVLSGRQYVSRNATLSDVTIGDGGIQYMYAGVMLAAVMVSSGGAQRVSSGATASATELRSGGLQQIYAQGKAVSAEISSGATQEVYSKGVATSAQVYGAQQIYAGGVASNGKVYGGTVNVLSGGTVNSTAILSGAMTISAAGVAYATVLQAGTVTVNYEGSLYGIEVASGATFELKAGALVGGTVTLSGAMTAAGTVFGSGITLQLELADRTTTDSFMIEGLDYLSVNSYTLTISATQATGKYQLASGASSFSGMIAVYTEGSSTPIGNLFAGSDFYSGKYLYTLEKANGELALDVLRQASSDIDRTGVSEVVFQWQVNGTIGCWMNGTNIWESSNMSLPDNWTVLGARDFSGDHQSDLLLVGAVSGDDYNGVYIGYYQDGDTSNWHTIGYLDKSNSNDWEVSIGNLTGNWEKASVIFHSKEEAVIGAWIDGTDEWVNLGSNWDENWEVVGAGDFDGSGSESILVAYRNSAYYALDIDGNAVEMAGSADTWEVRAIGDFDGDSKDDVIAYNSELGLVAKWADGQSSQWSLLGQLDAADWFVVGAGDYNGDGKDDLLVRQYSSGMLGYYADADFSQWNELGRGVSMDWKVIA